MTKPTIPTTKELRTWNKKARVQYLSGDFYTFTLYYFPRVFKTNPADFHVMYCLFLQLGLNIDFIGFRGCAKTMYLKYYFIFCICFKRRRFLSFVCFDKKKAEQRLFDIAIQLQTNKRLLQDFGQMFYGDLDDWKSSRSSQKKSVGEFITSNEIKVKAFGMGESMRGELYGASDGEYRPDLVGYDDLDVVKSVQNKKVIEQNRFKFENEMQGSLSRNCQQVFLGNVIKKDGVVPRLVEKVKNFASWRHFRVPIEVDGKPTRDFYTEDDLNQLRYQERWPSSYKQNGLLVPHQSGDTMITEDLIAWISHDDVPKDLDYVILGNDTASSLKEKTDSYATVAVGHKHINGVCYYWVLDAKELKEEQKRQSFIVSFNQTWFDMFGATCINIENKQSAIWISQQYDELGIRNELLDLKGDKWNKLLKHEKVFYNKRIFFVNNVGNRLLTDQLTDFTGEAGNPDDLVDALVLAMEEPTYWQIA